jgi:beta-fructofuranosidase
LVAVLSREDEWVWDSWYVVDGDELHAFYLMAPKSLGDSDLRHTNARIGHSVSTDARTWTQLPDAFGPSSGETFDNLAIWTGSMVKDSGLWHFFYTGINRETRERVQKLGHATSTDLITWTRVSETPMLEAAHPYATASTSVDGAEHFRDPWVFRHEDTWHMTVTSNETQGWGTVAHATSDDLYQWTLQPALVTESHLKQIEVTETLRVDGSWVLVFCMAPRDVEREGIAKAFATYTAPALGPIGPFDLDKSSPIRDGIYAGRVVEFRGEVLLLGFVDSGEPGGFQGVICDPIPLVLNEHGTLSAQ